MKNAFKIMNIMNENGFETQIAGGAVRDILLKKIPEDIDLATVATPEQVKEIFQNLNYQVVETGLHHGTVSVIMDRKPYEITTLRIDKNPDGRHAKVEYTNSWLLDSSRRDFTVNSMFMDSKCRIYDFHGGQEDLRNMELRFVGGPRQRISEDFLRILRYFRFAAKYSFKMNDFDLEQISQMRFGLYNISNERIYSEIKKIIQYSEDNSILNVMKHVGVLQVIFGENVLKPENFVKHNDAQKFHLTLFRMGVGSDWFREYKAPNDIIKDIKFFETFVLDFPYYNMFVHGKERIKDYHWLNDLDWEYEDLEIPKFPYSGRDFPEYTGKALGDHLKKLQKEWARKGFKIKP